MYYSAGITNSKQSEILGRWVFKADDKSQNKLGYAVAANAVSVGWT